MHGIAGPPGRPASCGRPLVYRGRKKCLERTADRIGLGEKLGPSGPKRRRGGAKNATRLASGAPASFELGEAAFWRAALRPRRRGAGRCGPSLGKEPRRRKPPCVSLRCRKRSAPRCQWGRPRSAGAERGCPLSPSHPHDSIRARDVHITGLLPAAAPWLPHCAVARLALWPREPFSLVARVEG